MMNKIYLIWDYSGIRDWLETRDKYFKNLDDLKSYFENDFMLRWYIYLNHKIINDKVVVNFLDNIQDNEQETFTLFTLDLFK